MDEPTTGVTTADDRPFRFFDNREKYLMFVTTCSEKQVAADRIGREVDELAHAAPHVLTILVVGVISTGEGDYSQVVGQTSLACEREQGRYQLIQRQVPGAADNDDVLVLRRL